MPRKCKKLRKNTSIRSNHETWLSDTTISQYADSNNCSKGGRMKKSVVGSIISKVKQMNIQDDDRAWDEQLDEFDEVLNNKSNDNYYITEKNTLSALEDLSTADRDHRIPVSYPIDVWSLISDFIHPEDVGTFACICQNSRYVVSTPFFWFKLYRRFYKKNIKLPERLQPECMVRHQGLRACVIRSLYFLYPPFAQKAVNFMKFNAEPHQLIKRQCVLMWYEKYKNQYIFSFKLKQVDHRKKPMKKQNLMDLLDDIFFNSEEGCKVLQVTCSNFIPIPMVLGLTLLSVSLTLDHTMQSKLQLFFGSGPPGRVTAGSTQVIFNPAMNIRVMDWWHPHYPHQSL